MPSNVCSIRNRIIMALENDYVQTGSSKVRPAHPSSLQPRRTILKWPVYMESDLWVAIL
jgi:hypothetical protein